MTKAYNFLLVFTIFANTYCIPSAGIGYGEILLIPLLPILFFRSLKKHGHATTQAYGMYIFFLIYALVVTLINVSLFPEIDFGETLKRLIRNFYYVLLFIYFSRYFFNYLLAKKYFTYFSVALAGFVIVQFVTYYFLGIYIDGHIPGLSIDASMLNEHTLKAAEFAGYVRPTGFLSECANCAHVLGLSLIIELVPYKGEEPNKKLIILYIAGLVMTTSANAFVEIFVAGALWVLFKLRNRKSSFSRAGVVISSVVAILLFISVIPKIPMVYDVVERLTTINEATDNSAGLRVLRGPAFFNEMNPVSKTVGIGFGNFLGYKKHFQINTIHEEDDEYMASLPDYLVSTGIIGFCLLLLCILVSFRNKPHKNRDILILLLVICVSSSIAHSPIWVLYLSFALWGNHLDFNSKYNKNESIVYNTSFN